MISPSPAEEVAALAVSDLARFANLANDSYYVSSHQDASKSRLLLLEVSVELLRLDEQIQALQGRKKLLSSIKNGLQSHTSLISRIPVEVLQKIFASAVDWSPLTNAWFADSPWWKGHEFNPEKYSDLAPHGSRFGDTLQSPWNVSQVCKRWRDVVLTTPQLWTYVEIDLDWHIWDNLSRERLVWFLDLTLSRSHPYGINLVTIGNSSNTRDEVKQMIYPLLIQHIHQWQRVASFSSVHNHIPALSGRSIPDELRLLRNVALGYDIFPSETRLPGLETWYYPREYTINFAKWCPRYDTISSLRCRMSKRATETLIPDLDMIGSMIQLRTLRITVDIDKFPEMRSRIQLPTVQELGLGFESTPFSPGHALELLSTPSLKNLHLSSVGSALPLVDFTIHSGCSLSSLRIDTAYLDNSGLLDVLCLTPSLEFLKVAFIPLGKAPCWWEVKKIGVLEDSMLEQLFDSDRTILPLLRRVSLLNLKELNVDLMLEILDRRLKRSGDIPSLLKHVCVTLPGFETMPLYEEILRHFRCHYRFCVEIGPWKYFDEDVDLESEAQFTTEPSESEWSTSESEDESLEERNKLPPFDWFGYHGLLDSDGDPSENYVAPSEDSDDDVIPAQTVRLLQNSTSSSSS